MAMLKGFAVTFVAVAISCAILSRIPKVNAFVGLA